MPWDYDNYLFAVKPELNSRAAIDVLQTSAFVPESVCYIYEEHAQHVSWGRSIRLGSEAGRWNCLSFVVGEYQNVAFICKPINANPLWRMIVHFATGFSTPHIAISWPGRCFDEDLTFEQRQLYTDLIGQVAFRCGADYILRCVEASLDKHFAFVDGIPVLDSDNDQELCLLWVKEGKPLPYGMSESRFRSLNNGYVECLDISTAQ